MKIEEFTSLTHDKQFLTTYSTGTFLTEKEYNGYLIKLYQIDSFYVQVITLKVSGKVLVVKAFDDTNNLDPFLSDVDIADFLKDLPL